MKRSSLWLALSTILSSAMIAQTASTDARKFAVVLDPAASAIEYRNGNRTKWGSAGIGLMVGATIGGVAGLASGDDVCEPGWFGCLFAYTAGEKAVMGIMGGGLLGALVGVVAIPASRWIPLRTDAGEGVALLIEPNRLGMTLRF